MVEQQAQDQMYARHVRWAEMNAIGEIEDDPNWGEAVQRLVRCVTDHGTVILTGMGKIGYVCQRVASTMSSVGIPAIFLHPGEAVHGDLGFVRAEDIVLACSNSGKTEEVLTVVQRITDKQIIVCVGDTESPLAQLGLMLTFGKHREPDPLNVAPSASIAAMSAVLDALTFCVQGHLNFTMEDYAHNHHAGYLGRKARGEEK